MKPCIYAYKAGLRKIDEVFETYASLTNFELIDASNELVPCNKKPVLVHGPYNFLRKKKEFLPDYIFFDEANFFKKTWVELFGRKYMYHHGEVRTPYELTNEWYGIEEPIQIETLRITDPAIYPGLYTRREFEVAARCSSLTDESKLWVCREVKYIDEYMLWVAGGEVIATTLYKENGKLFANRHASCNSVVEFVKREVIGKFPEFAYAVNVAHNQQWGHQVVSFTPINATIWHDKDLGIEILDGWMKALIKREENK